MPKINHETITALRDALSAAAEAVTEISQANGQLDARDQAVTAAEEALQKAEQARSEIDAQIDAAISSFKDAVDSLSTAAKNL